MLPDALRNRPVVVVNEFPANVGLHTGHVDLSFYRYGHFEGTFGQNVGGGKPLSGRRAPSWFFPGGVFVESEAGARQHFVVVSDVNYIAIHNYALSRAQRTATRDTHYFFFFNNCADFVREAFAVSALPEKYKDIRLYISNHSEPVAAYVDTTNDIIVRARSGIELARKLGQGAPRPLTSGAGAH